jgi:hypothetical protein
MYFILLFVLANAVIDVIKEAKDAFQNMNKKLSAKLRKKQHSDVSKLSATVFLVEKLRLKEKQLPARRRLRC